MVVEGELSETERAALTSLAGGFEPTVQGVTGNTVGVNLQGFAQFERQVIAKLERTTSL